MVRIGLLHFQLAGLIGPVIVRFFSWGFELVSAKINTATLESFRPVLFNHSPQPWQSLCDLK
jgi:hypothetical protein